MRIRSALRRSLTALLLAAALAPAAHAEDGSLQTKPAPLARARTPRAVRGWSHVIVRATDNSSAARLTPVIEQLAGRVGRPLPLINGIAAYVPDAALVALAAHQFVQRVSLDRRVVGTLERTNATIGASHVWQQLGYDGSGVGVAIIDSGVMASHGDLSQGMGPQRVRHFVDFVNRHQTAYDDYGHGTHVAGIIAGNGFNSDGARSGVAPGAHLIVLKVLDGTGVGRVSDVIAALDYVIENKDALDIRVVNLSLAAGVYESYSSDPLTLAAKRAVSAGLVVVASAGNRGGDPAQSVLYGGVTAPGNAPWVLTVGASSHMGTVDRTDDTVAAFSSRGPSAVEHTAKPDLVAPGVGIESLSNPESAFYTTQSAYLLGGTHSTPFLPYLSLSGTSVAAPVVTGTVALMLHANPALTPNQVKAVLQYTATASTTYDPLTQGAGFVNAQGAVQLARFLAKPSDHDPVAPEWSQQIIWANHRIVGGRFTTAANAWATDVMWGSALTPRGALVQWGVIETDGVRHPWAVACSDALCSTFNWGARPSPNVVWGNKCGGADCSEPWSVQAVAAAADDTVVWGTLGSDTVVWGTNADTVVWGTAEDDTVVWGTIDEDAVVW